MKRVTVKDLARLLSVAPSTVSRALADHPDISDETKRRVREAAETLGYIPNLRARYLRAKHSRLVALVVPEVNMFFAPSLMSGVDGVHTVEVWPAARRQHALAPGQLPGETSLTGTLVVHNHI